MKNKEFYGAYAVPSRESYGKIRIFFDIQQERPFGSISNLQSCEQESEEHLRAMARAVYLARRQRSAILPPEIGEPAWNILLELFVRGVPISTKHACLAADTPSTTALRWINVLESNFCVERLGDPKDGRRTFVELTEFGEELVRTALAAKAKVYARYLEQPRRSEEARK